MNYSDIIGQKNSIRYLKRTTSNNKQNHALIFDGADGMGKMTLAMVYAKSLLCSSEEKPCDKCASCRKFEHKNHLDFKIVEPAKRKTISTEDISEMLSDAYLIPNEGGQKIYIIQKAHLMTHAAQNKLLKIIEEPPEYLVIMLLCDNISNILSTIISRSVTLKMQALSEKQIANELVKLGQGEEKAVKIAAMSSGNLGYALNLSSDKKAIEKYEKYSDAFFSVEGNKLESFSFLEKRREEISEILVCWAKILSDCLKIKTRSSDVSYSEKEIIYAKKYETSEIISKLDYILQAESRLASNAQYLPTVDWLLSNL